MNDNRDRVSKKSGDRRREEGEDRIGSDRIGDQYSLSPVIRWRRASDSPRMPPREGRRVYESNKQLIQSIHAFVMFAGGNGRDKCFNTTLYVLFNRFKTMYLLLQSISDLIRVHCFDFDATTGGEEYLVPKLIHGFPPGVSSWKSPRFRFVSNQH